jgi:uncharacterized membrane protein
LSDTNSKDVKFNDKPSARDKIVSGIKNHIMWLAYIGIIVLIIGILIISVGIIPKVQTKTSQEIQEDYDILTDKFESYNTGDRIFISGTVTEIIDMKYSLASFDQESDNSEVRYIYIIDESLEIHVDEKIAQRNDRITVECEVQERNFGPVSEHFLKVKNVYNTELLIIFGFLVSTIGFLFFYSSMKIRKESKSEFSSTAAEIAQLYRANNTKDDESLLYQKIRTQSQDYSITEYINRLRETPIDIKIPNEVSLKNPNIKRQHNRIIPSSITKTQLLTAIHTKSKIPREANTNQQLITTQVPNKSRWSNIAKHSTPIAQPINTKPLRPLKVKHPAIITQKYNRLKFEDEEMALYYSMQSTAGSK